MSSRFEALAALAAALACAVGVAMVVWRRDEDRARRMAKEIREVSERNRRSKRHDTHRQ